MDTKTILPIVFLLSSPLSAQVVIDWNTLADVKFTQKFSAEYGINYDEAAFGNWLLAMDGREVKISGYLIPIDGLGLSWVLSRNPNSTCFFCGGAGPKTVVELRLKPAAVRRYKLDEFRTFKGKLKLNRENLNSLTYMLLDAE